MNPYSVYVKTDDQNRIVAINSSAFLEDLTGWTKIAEGRGDKYHHAQGNFFDKPITDDGGIFRYKLKDGQIVECTQEDMDVSEETREPTHEERIAALEQENAFLKETLEIILSGAVEDEDGESMEEAGV